METIQISGTLQAGMVGPTQLIILLAVLVVFVVITSRVLWKQKKKD